MKHIKVGIIGFAHLHPLTYIPHFEACEGMEFIAASDPDCDLLARGLSQLALPRDIECYGDYHQMIDGSGADLVAIFSPHYQCPEVVEYAAAKGKHILVEKPMAASVEGGERILKATQNAQIVSSTPYVWRYHQAAIEIKRLLENGFLGDIFALEGRCIAGRIQRYIDGNSGWILDKRKGGGGPMWNLGVHWIDLFNWFLGGLKPLRAYCEMNSITPGCGVEENAHGIVFYENGITANYNIGYSSPPSYPYGRDLHINIRGTLGSITWNPAFEGEEDEIFLCSDHPDLADAPNRTIRLLQKAAPGYAGIMGLRYIKDFAFWISKAQKPSITIAEGVEAIKVAELLYRAAETKQVVCA
ncbi:Gfo/Idh/MocA family oxidoreductase [candidate division KSB1 bacterium]|nr:Gfo/Idh/MocA family oxidoreductase [candidate division KSB1 bacterium]